MNIRNAILSAANHIEQNPHLFDFMSVRVPENPCGTPGCAIGWIGHFAEVGGWVAHNVAPAMGLKAAAGDSDAAHEFYRRMDALGKDGWRKDAEVCASALRLYADHYHPATSLVIYRNGADIVRDILEKKVAA